MLRKKVLLLPLTAAMMIGIAQAQACTIGPFDQAAYDSSPLIFEGSIIRTNDQDINETTGEITSRTYLFNVDKIWKGPAQMRNVIVHDSGAEFIKSTTYLIVTDSTGGGYSADIHCGHSAPLASVGDTINFLSNQATLSIED